MNTRFSSMIRPRGLVALALGAGLLAMSACAHQRDPLQMGLKRVALDLTFKDQSKAKPPTVQQVVATPQLAPAPAAFVATIAPMPAPVTEDAPLPLRPIPPLTAKCPKAPDGAVPTTPASVFIGAPPAVGMYTQHNTGTYSLMAATQNVNGAYPNKSEVDVENIKSVTNTVVTAGGQTPENDTFFDVVNKTPISTVTTTYEVRGGGVGPTTAPPWALAAGELDLVKTVTVENGTTTTFNPTPTIAVMYFKGEGASWHSAGIDTATNTVMSVQGSIDKRESVDVCGTVYDAYHVISNEQIVNVNTGYSSRTDANDPNVYDVATQLGGLFVQEHVDTATTFTVNNVPVVLNLNYTSTLDSVTPQALQGQAAAGHP